MTAPDGKDATALVLHAESVGYFMAHEGNFEKPWAAFGYYGVKVGPLAWGRRQDGAILVVSGPQAGETFRKIYREGFNVTRLDVQVTVKHEPAKKGVASNAFKKLLATGIEERRGVGSRLVVGSAGGSTCYVGARSSLAFGRIYDKFAESQDETYRGCWRWEVELKAEYAAALATTLCNRGDWADSIPAIVHEWYSLRGLLPDFVAYGNGVHFTPRGSVSDSERQLRWLEKQVAPTIATLRRAGYEQNVLTSLGLLSAPTGKGTSLASDNFGSHGPAE